MKADVQDVHILNNNTSNEIRAVWPAATPFLLAISPLLVLDLRSLLSVPTIAKSAIELGIQTQGCWLQLSSCLKAKDDICYPRAKSNRATSKAVATHSAP